MMQDRSIFSQNKIDFSCIGCSQTQHTIMQCPQVFYQAPKDRIIKSIQLSLPQIRLKMNRRVQRFQKPLSIQKYIEQIGILFQQSLAIQQSAAKISTVFDNPTKNFISQQSYLQEYQVAQVGFFEKTKKSIQKSDLQQQKILKLPYHHIIDSQNTQNTYQSLQQPESQNVSSNLIQIDGAIPYSTNPLNPKERKLSILLTKPNDDSISNLKERKVSILVTKTNDEQTNTIEWVPPNHKERKSVMVSRKSDNLDDVMNYSKDSFQQNHAPNKKYNVQFSLLERKYTNDGVNNTRPQSQVHDDYIQDNHQEDVKTESSNDDSQNHYSDHDVNPQQQLIRMPTNPKIRVQSQSISSFAHHSLQRIKTIDNEIEYASAYPQYQNNTLIGQSLFIIDNFDRGKDFEIYNPMFNITPTLLRANMRRNNDIVTKIRNSRTKRTRLIETQEKIKKIQKQFRKQKGSVKVF